ncbi:hypothetical protein FB107DRAFT_260974 [Schizophyllum commune]
MTTTVIEVALALPFVLAAGVLGTVALTPPKAALQQPPDAEQAPERQTLLEKTAYRNVAVTNFMEKSFIWIATLPDILSLVFGRLLPDYRISHLILRPFFRSSGHPELVWHFTRSGQWALPFGVFLVIAGAAIRLVCFRILRRMFTFTHTIKKDHQLMTTGPYSVVRHPSYTGVLMVFWGKVVWQTAPGSWMRESGFLHTAPGIAIGGLVVAFNVFFTIAFMIRCKEEDRALEKAFGEQWRTWAERTRYCLIPGIF